MSGGQDYSDWIGRRFSRTEPISERLLDQYRATMAGMLAPGAVPPGFHWVLVPDVAEPADLGRDGHPRTGLFVPRLPLPRRMWAGGSLVHDGAFATGDLVTRDTEVGEITFKSGASGPLGFVSLTHNWSVAGAVVLRERLDLVYREDPQPGAAPAAPAPAEDWACDAMVEITPDPILLFRYSALTFNGHRIHYDHLYATGVEGYGGLVVHGPMQAVWMLNLATRILGGVPRRFDYRGLTPLICGIPVRVEARAEGGSIALRVRRLDGVVTMQATAWPRAEG